MREARPEVRAMGRALAIVLVLGSLTVFLTVYTQGVDRAYGGAIARLWKDDDARPRWPAEPVPRQRVAETSETWEERTPPRPIGQRVRERVNDAVAEGARRHGGE